jgi:hypothetical protein
MVTWSPVIESAMTLELQPRKSQDLLGVVTASVGCWKRIVIVVTNKTNRCMLKSGIGTELPKINVSGRCVTHLLTLSVFDVGFLAYHGTDNHTLI